MKWLDLVILLVVVWALILLMFAATGCSITASRVMYEGVGQAAVSVAEAGVDETLIAVGEGMAEGENPEARGFDGKTVLGHEEEGKSEAWTLHVKVSKILALPLTLLAWILGPIL